MLQILLLFVLGISHAVPIPVSNFLGYNLPYFYNFNQPNNLAAASFNNPSSFGIPFPPAQGSQGFQHVNPFAFQSPYLSHGAPSFPQAGFSGNVIPPSFSPARQHGHELQPPFGHIFAASPHAISPHASFQSFQPITTSFPHLGQPVHNPLSPFHRQSIPNHYSTSPSVNSYAPKVDFQRINLPPIVRENKLEIRQPVLNTVRYVQPTLYKVNRDRTDIDDDKYDFDDDDYKMAYSLQSQPTVLTYSIRTPSRDYTPEHSPLSYAVQSHPTLFKRSQPENYGDDHEFEDEESGEAKFKSVGKHEENSGEEEEEEKEKKRSKELI